MDFPDVNVLVSAFRSDDPHHAVCKAWLDALVLGEAQFGISPLAPAAVVRIATNKRAFAVPSPPERVFAYCDNLLSQPHCSVIEPGERHWRIFRDLCIKTGTRGPRVSDVWFAALAIEHGCTSITFDRGYARFSGLAWQEPAA